MIRRRQFISLLGGAAAWPCVARAQPTAMPVIGFLRSASADGSTHLVGAFRRGLNETGFVEGQNVAIEYRWAEDQLDRLPGLAADLVRRRVAVLVGSSVSSARALMAASAETPIVFVTGVDPVRTSLVQSLSRPGGNVTGVSFTTIDLLAKQIGLLHELVPKASTIAVLSDPNAGEPETELSDAQEAGRAIGRQIKIVRAASESKIGAAFATIVQANAGALFVRGGPLFVGQRRQLVARPIRHGLPASYATRDFAEIGGLMSYGASQTDVYRRTGIYTGRILKGEKPGDLPVELSTRFELVINLGTAKAIGIDLPPMLLARADEVIE
jgi:ABC-type uncharacterized transport system substrate-binding protein